MEEDAVHTRRNEILHGSIYRTLFTLGWPVMLSNAFQTVYNLADTYWVSQFSVISLAAITLSWPMVFFFLSLAIGLSSAGTSLISQYTGAKREEDRDHAASQLFSFMLLLSIGLGVTGYVFAGRLVQLLGSTPVVYRQAKIFLEVIFLGMPALFTYFAFITLLRAHGDTKTPMYLSAFTLSINLVLDPFLIFGWAFFPTWGIMGAAITDVLGRLLAAIIGVYFLFSGRVGITLHMDFLVPKVRWIKKILSIAVPTTLSMITTSIGAIVITFFVALAGPDALSVYGIGSRVVQVLNILIWGITSGLAIMIGQNLGANQIERAREVLTKSLFSIFLTTGIGGILIFLFRYPIYRFFVTEPHLIQEGTTFLGMFTLSVPFFGIYMFIISLFRGSGHTTHTMYLAMIRLWGIRVLFTYLLFIVLDFGVIGIWIALLLGNLLGGTIALLWGYIVKWEERIIKPKKAGSREVRVVE